MIKARIAALQALMKERNMDAYVIPTADFHETEYVGEYFKARHFMSGFTGSAGTLIVTQKEAGLWSDGRYFIQAEKELQGTGITLMKAGEEGTPSLVEYVDAHLQEHGALGFDGRVVNTALADSFLTIVQAKQATMKVDEDLVGMLWLERPSLSCESAFALDVSYSGKLAKDKLRDIRIKMKEFACDTHIVTSLDDIAWILNMRGNDVTCFPVVLAYLIISEKDATLYIDEQKLDATLRTQFSNDQVVIKPYDAIYEDVKTLHGANILLDKARVNYKITSSLPSDVSIRVEKNPSLLMKAIKNETELANLRLAHIKDGVAVTKFMYWLKHNVGKGSITEVQASAYLEALRREQEHFIEPSFDTICAYNENAAMMHYHANAETCATLAPSGLLLVDSGGQYLEGTTDITRTFALGQISETMKLHYSTVLRSMIALAKANFLYGCRGVNLDILARGPIWDLNLDYKCGTGHGVGYLSNVHEAPNGFRWKMVKERDDSAILEAGMVTTDEPGIYLEGQYGIRHENELISQLGEKNEYGHFMNFETITFAPFDLDAIDPAVLTTAERAWLNAYHQEVYQKLSPYMSEAQQEWLKEYTRSI